VASAKSVASAEAAMATPSVPSAGAVMAEAAFRVSVMMHSKLLLFQ
jgi:hypothetical protein